MSHFKWILLKSNALFHLSLPIFCAQLEGLFLHVPQLCLDCLHAFNWIFWWTPWSCRKQKYRTEHDQMTMNVLLVRWSSSRSVTSWYSGRCEHLYWCRSAARNCPDRETCEKMQCFKKVEVTDIYYRDMLYDNTISLSLFHPELRQHNLSMFTSQADLIYCTLSRHISICLHHCLTFPPKVYVS